MSATPRESPTRTRWSRPRRCWRRQGAQRARRLSPVDVLRTGYKGLVKVPGYLYEDSAMRAG